MASDEIIDLYERHARQYDRDRGRTLQERAWVEKFSNSVAQGGTVLDIGCGTGEPIAQYLTERGFSVFGVDSSTTMIEMCRERMPKSEWFVADMRMLALGRQFHGVVAWDSFFHLTMEDQRKMFARFASHCQSGAPLLFTSGPSAGESIGSYYGEPLYHASLDPMEYRQLLSDHGFVVLEHCAEDPECGGHTVWLARKELEDLLNPPG